MTLYNERFYAGQSGGSATSAQLITPFILQAIPAKTVLDVGCGIGTWASAFEAQGVEAWGIDGPWVQRDALMFPAERFAAVNFESPPFEPAIPERFDLVTTFEFLEHVSGSRAEALVQFLTSRADVVVAGAAVPGQGGKNHVNEQWPAYWRGLFEARGYVAYDFLRPLVWGLEVDPWYAQNTIGYFKGAVPEAVRQRAEAAALAALRDPQPLVHPELFRRKMGENAKMRHKLKWGPLRRLVKQAR